MLDIIQLCAKTLKKRHKNLKRKLTLYAIPLPRGKTFPQGRHVSKISQSTIQVFFFLSFHITIS